MRVVGKRIEADGQGHQAQLRILLVHLDQMRKGFFARQSEIAPEIDQDDLAAILEHGILETIVFHDLELDRSVLRVPGKRANTGQAKAQETPCPFHRFFS